MQESHALTKHAQFGYWNSHMAHPQHVMCAKKQNVSLGNQSMGEGVVQMLISIFTVALVHGAIMSLHLRKTSDLRTR